MIAARLLLAALHMQPTAPTTGDVFCDDIRTMFASAMQRQPFQDLRSRAFLPRLLNDCVADAAGYVCEQRRARAGQTRDVYARRIRQCMSAWPQATTFREIDLHGNDEIVIQASAFQARVVSQRAGRFYTIVIAIRAVELPSAPRPR